MCGRYADFLTEQELQDTFAIAELADDARLLPPSYNIAPTQPARVLVPASDGLHLVVARWGLVPHWAKDASFGSRTFNARSETAAEKPSFRSAFKRGRIVVPASGYYEWETLPDGKHPHFIHDATGAPLAFAGLIEHGGAGDKGLTTFSILTRAARGELTRIHDREPIMLTPDAREAWVDPKAERAELEAVLAADGPDTAMHEVAKAVGNVRNNGPELVEPAP